MAKQQRIYTEVRPKKFLGQHFLTDESIAQQIVDSLILPEDVRQVLEIGPGMGVLTKYLVEKKFNLHVVELDKESVVYLHENFPKLKEEISEQDVLQMDFNVLDEKIAVIGNFPYNISSQILFKVLDRKEQVMMLVGMFQKEVAERVTSGPGSKNYGILSVLLQAWYDCEYLFTVDALKFHPPPKVQSGVIRLHRNSRKQLKCAEDVFKKVIKQAFNQRRKTLRNSLKSIVPGVLLDNLPYASLRPEQLSWQQFEELASYIYNR